MPDLTLTVSTEEVKMLIDHHGKVVADGCNASDDPSKMPLADMAQAAERIASLCHQLALANMTSGG